MYENPCYLTANMCYACGPALRRELSLRCGWGGGNQAADAEVGTPREAYSALHGITLQYMTLHCIVLHCSTLHYIVVHCIALHYIALRDIA